MNASASTSVTLARRLEHWPPSTLVPYSRNAKLHSAEQIDALASLILKVGFAKPIICDDKRVVLAGHGARLAALKLGLEEVPVIVLSHLTETEKRAYVLADNRLGELSTWNRPLIAEELSALDLERFDFTMTGFSDRDLEQMLDELAGAATDPLTPSKGTRMSTNQKSQTAAANPNAPAAASTPAAQASATTAPQGATVASESDARVVNSTDAAGNVMRHAYRVLNDDEKRLMVELKDAGLALWNKIHALDAAGSRELSIAKTKCQEAVFWAVYHITK